MTKKIVMTEEEFREETDNTCNLGFKHGADLVLNLAKLTMPLHLYDLMETAVYRSEAYVAGKKVEEEDAAWKAWG